MTRPSSTRTGWRQIFPYIVASTAKTSQTCSLHSHKPLKFPFFTIATNLSFLVAAAASHLSPPPMAPGRTQETQQTHQGAGGGEDPGDEGACDEAGASGTSDGPADLALGSVHLTS